MMNNYKDSLSLNAQEFENIKEINDMPKFDLKKKLSLIDTAIIRNERRKKFLRINSSFILKNEIIKTNIKSFKENQNAKESNYQIDFLPSNNVSFLHEIHGSNCPVDKNKNLKINEINRFFDSQSSQVDYSTKKNNKISFITPYVKNLKEKIENKKFYHKFFQTKKSNQSERSLFKSIYVNNNQRKKKSGSKNIYENLISDINSNSLARHYKSSSEQIDKEIFFSNNSLKKNNRESLDLTSLPNLKNLFLDYNKKLKINITNKYLILNEFMENSKVQKKNFDNINNLDKCEDLKISKIICPKKRINSNFFSLKNDSSNRSEIGINTIFNSPLKNVV